MNKPLLFAAVCAGLPACAALATPPGTESWAAGCEVQDGQQNRPRDHPHPASGALPARASTGPEPQRGTVAPSTRVPSHVVTPSMRAMERASAARAGNMTDVDKKAQNNCADTPAPGAPQQGTTKPAAA
ncbi:MAG: hypothetical protein JWP72_474 [Massilia sp.]|nr:hypothetical protein [Massilia sp.]MDB5790893.1 hypothetical protein [Massilia sp.]